MTTVCCPLKLHDTIAVSRCVEWQAANGCSCQHARLAKLAVRELRKMAARPVPNSAAREPRIPRAAGAEARSPRLDLIPDADFLRAYESRSILQLRGLYGCSFDAVKARCTRLGLKPRAHGVRVPRC